MGHDLTLTRQKKPKCLMLENPLCTVASVAGFFTTPILDKTMILASGARHHTRTCATRAVRRGPATGRKACIIRMRVGRQDGHTRMRRGMRAGRRLYPYALVSALSLRCAASCGRDNGVRDDAQLQPQPQPQPQPPALFSTESGAGDRRVKDSNVEGLMAFPFDSEGETSWRGCRPSRMSRSRH
jgi:hypothetical protein